jgi:hypothetical protein
VHQAASLDCHQIRSALPSPVAERHPADTELKCPPERSSICDFHDGVTERGVSVLAQASRLQPVWPQRRK